MFSHLLVFRMKRHGPRGRPRRSRPERKCLCFDGRRKSCGRRSKRRPGPPGTDTAWCGRCVCLVQKQGKEHGPRRSPCATPWKLGSFFSQRHTSKQSSPLHGSVAPCCEGQGSDFIQKKTGLKKYLSSSTQSRSQFWTVIKSNLLPTVQTRNSPCCMQLAN